jgi:type IV pilus assembly protein PilB
MSTAPNANHAAPAAAAATAANALSNLPGVARALIGQGVIDETKAKSVVHRANSEAITFLEALSKDNRQVARRASETLAKMFDMPLLDLDAVEREQMPPEPISDRKKMEELRAIPICIRGNRMMVATADPTNTAIIDFFGHKTGKRIDIAVV